MQNNLFLVLLIMNNILYKEQFKEFAYIYIISDDNGYMKIGVSKNPEKRLKQLQTGHPTNLKLLYTEEFYCKRNHLLKIEALIHKEIKNIAHRVKGEWFEIPLDKFEEIKNIIILYRIQYEDNETALKYNIPIF